MARNDDDREFPIEAHLSLAEQAEYDILIEASDDAENDNAEDLQDALERFTAADDSTTVATVLAHRTPSHRRAMIDREWRPATHRPPRPMKSAH